MSQDTIEEDEEEITWEEVVGWLEFGCWTTLALAPMLYYVNGPAVSTDQSVVRTALVCLAAAGAVGIRGYKLVRDGGWMKRGGG